MAVGPPRRDGRHARERRGEDAARGPVALAELAPRASKGGSVALAGDAWHPMTPILGQGVCCALEGSVDLARCLAGAGSAQVPLATRRRDARVRGQAVGARRLVGALVQWDNAVVCAVRNGVLISRLVRLGFLFVF
jgi:2-polyprenyl-6-methoxyphenol hydroxylase-like FAD-dependent oxidoreductase